MAGALLCIDAPALVVPAYSANCILRQSEGDQAHRGDRQAKPGGLPQGGRRVGLRGTAISVVEDAPAGISAGRAAGAQVLAVTTTHDTAELADADVVVTDLSCVSVEVTDGGVALLIA